MKSNNKCYIAFVCLGLTCLLLLCTNAEAQSAKVLREGSSEYPAYYSLSWMDEKLTGNDKPYASIRSNVEAISRRKSLNDRLVASYRLDYSKRPNDPKLLYRWAYALYAQSGNPKWREQVRLLTTGYFWKVPSPHSYEYARLRWLSQAIEGPMRSNDREKIRDFGERLLLRNPNDYYVLYSMVDYAANGKDVEYAQRMVRLQPNKRSAVATLAFAQFKKFLRTHTQKDADVAIVTHQKLLQMLPANDKNGREDVLKTIAHIRKVRARWADKVS